MNEGYFSIPWVPRIVFHDNSRVGIFVPKGVRLILPCFTRDVWWADRESLLPDRVLVLFAGRQLDATVDNRGLVISIANNHDEMLVEFHQSGEVCYGSYMVVPNPDLAACLESEIRRLCDCKDGKRLPVRPKAPYPPLNAMVNLPVPLRPRL